MSMLGDAELVRGEIVQMPPASPAHGGVCGNVYFLLRTWAAMENRFAVVPQDSGVLTEHDPDTVRGPDVFVIERKRLPQQRLPFAALDMAPELTVEVLSPSDRWPNVMHKILEYLRNGTVEVWVIDPELQSLKIYRADLQRPLEFNADAELTRPDLLPGFCCRVADFFADL